jgi:hypothetical protein
MTAPCSVDLVAGPMSARSAPEERNILAHLTAMTRKPAHAPQHRQRKSDLE